MLEITPTVYKLAHLRNNSFRVKVQDHYTKRVISKMGQFINSWSTS